MAKSKKTKKETKKRLDFSQKLAHKLREMGFGEVEEGTLSDQSGKWVELRDKGVSLTISFDIKGEKIERVGLYKDKVEVVDVIRVWGN